jgi:putative peptide zinc metalloprotease protein
MSVAFDHESAADRALGLRARPDLQFCPQRFGGQRYWAVKDPAALKYFHLRDEEHAILEMLDGSVSINELRRGFERAFAPRRVTEQQLHGFLATLHRYGLLLAESPDQGQQLLTRRDDQYRRRQFEALLGVLAIRFRGVNPSRVLDLLYPKFAWLFSPACVLASVLLALAAVLLIAVEFGAFVARLPEVSAIVSASNLPWLLVALAVIKILHEMAHALACRRFGGDCHEVGIMLLVFTPCLYCNVSDSWMLPSKWQRIAVSAAGMYMELILASVCTLLWWFSAPGLFNSLCLNTILICSIGTVVLNGNPLLRYDGYYILSDLVEVPNLREQASAAARRVLARTFLGLELTAPGGVPPRRQGLLVAYWICATVYRWMVVIAILWALNLIARPYHLEPLVALVACVTLTGMVGPSVLGTMRWASDPTRRRRVAPLRVFVTGVAVLGILLAVVLWPMSMHVRAPLVLEYRDAQRVYVTIPGRLTSSARAGQRVAKDEPLAQLASGAVSLELTGLSSERDRQRLFLANLETRRLQGVDDGARIPTATAALADIDKRLGQLQHEAAELTVVAPIDGTVLPPPALLPDASSDKLRTWSGTPLEERNIGSYLETGTLLCLVGDPNRFEAVLHLAENDVELVQPGQRVRMVLDHLPGRVFEGTVTDVAKLDLEVMPRSLAVAGDVPSQSDERGVRRPLDTWYQARVQFDEGPSQPVARVHGNAKVSVTPRSLGAQLARWLKQTFSR